MLTISELLQELNDKPEKLALVENKNNAYFRVLLKCAYLVEFKMNLPEGNPEYKPSGVSFAETKGAFWQEARRMESYVGDKMPKLRRETLFMQALEGLDEKSGQILLAVKDQTLDKMYPNLTKEVFQKHGYF